MSFPRRIVEDYDVDRLEVEVQQCMQLTSTNHPFGLIPIFGIGKKSDREWPVTIEGFAESKGMHSPCGCQRAGWQKRKLIVFGRWLIAEKNPALDHQL